MHKELNCGSLQNIVVLLSSNILFIQVFKLEISRNCTYALVCQVMLDNSLKKAHWDPQRSELNAQYGIWCSTFLPLLQDKHSLLIRLARIIITVLIGVCVCAYMCVRVCYTKESHLCWYHMLQYLCSMEQAIAKITLWKVFSFI